MQLFNRLFLPVDEQRLTSWLFIKFKYTPVELDRPPSFIIPHQPRLDWMVWFGEFLYRLHEGSADVTGLLAYNPFPKVPPRYLRVEAYRYRFTTPEEYEQTGKWWRREYLGQFPQVEPRRP